MRWGNRFPFEYLSIAIVAGFFWYSAGLAIHSHHTWMVFTSPFLALVGGILAGTLAGLAESNDSYLARKNEDWIKFECANCGDSHQPEHTCYCGCHQWRKGSRIPQ